MALEKAPNWSGKITRLSGNKLQNHRDARTVDVNLKLVAAAEAAIAALHDEEPGTFYLTDFLAREVSVRMDMDEAALRARFDACLLSDEEMASGPSTWTTWTNPFSDWP